MGYKVQFESGQTVEFDTKPTDADIEEAYAHVMKNAKAAPAATPTGSGIPDAAPESFYDRSEESETPLDKYVRGPIETAANLATGALSAPAAAFYGLGKKAITGEDADKAAGQFMEEYTYAPRGTAGQRYAGEIGKVINDVGIPLMGVHGMPAIRVKEGVNATRAMLPERKAPAEVPATGVDALKAEITAPKEEAPVQPTAKPLTREEQLAKNAAEVERIRREKAEAAAQSAREERLASESAFNEYGDTQAVIEARKQALEQEMAQAVAEQNKPKMDALKAALDGFDELGRQQQREKASNLDQSQQKRMSLDLAAEEKAKAEAAAREAGDVPTEGKTPEQRAAELQAEMERRLGTNDVLGRKEANNMLSPEGEHPIVKAEREAKEAVAAAEKARTEREAGEQKAMALEDAQRKVEQRLKSIEDEVKSKTPDLSLDLKRSETLSKNAFLRKKQLAAEVFSAKERRAQRLATEKAAAEQRKADIVRQRAEHEKMIADLRQRHAEAEKASHEAQRAAQEALNNRAEQTRLDVTKQTTLDMNAAERARQEAATVHPKPAPLGSKARRMGRAKKQGGVIDPDLLGAGAVVKFIKGVRDSGIKQPARAILDKFKGMFDEEALVRAYNESTDPKAREHLVMLKPNDFLHLAAQRGSEYMIGKIAREKHTNVREGLDTERGLRDVPYLQIDEHGQVIGHEGRHRMDILVRKGIDEVPVRIIHNTFRNEDAPAISQFHPQKDNVSIGTRRSLDAPESLIKEGQGDTWLNSNTFSGKYVPKGQRGGILLNWSSRQSLNNMPGPVRQSLTDIGDARIKTPQEAINLAKNAKDISMNKAQKAIDAFSKGGIMRKAKFNHPVFHYTVDRFLKAKQNADAAISNTLHGDYLTKLRGLSKDDFKLAHELLNLADLHERDITSAQMQKAGLSNALQDFIHTHQKVMKQALTDINAARAAAGKAPIQGRSGYSAMAMSGDYRQVVRKGDDVVGVISANTEKGLAKIREGLAQKDPSYSFSETKKAFGEKTFQRGSPHEAFYDVLENLASNNPGMKEFMDTLKDLAEQESGTYMQMQKHAMQKKGVFGMEGRKPWETAENNARQFFDNQAKYLENTMNWSELSKAAQEVNTVLKDDSVLQGSKNAANISEAYMRNAMGMNPSAIGRWFDSGFNMFADKLGIGPTNAQQYGIRLPRKIANTALLSLNPIFLGIQTIQGAVSMPAMHAMLAERGLVKDNIIPTFGMESITKAAITQMQARLFPQGLSTLDKAALKYIKDNHVAATDMVEHSSSTRADALYRVDSFLQHPAAVLESGTRGNMFLAFVDQLHKGGMKEADGLFEQAHRLTDMAMNNYNSMEKPQIYNALGPIGSIAYNLKSFGHNEISRWALFAREIGKADGVGGKAMASRALLTQMAVTIAAAGVMGLPFFSQWESLYDFITEKMGEPRSLSLDIMEMSEKLSDATDGKLNPYAISHGAIPTTLGVDLSKRIGLGDVLASNAGDVAFAGGGKLYQMGKAAFGAARSPDEEHMKAAAMQFAPPVLQGTLKDSWYTNGDLAMSQDPDKAVRTTARLNDLDKRLRVIGLTGINEAVQKEKVYQLGKIEQAYKDLQQKALVDMSHALSQGRSLEASARKFVEAQGNPMSLNAAITQMVKEQNLSPYEARLLRDAAGSSVTNAYKLQRDARYGVKQ